MVEKSLALYENTRSHFTKRLNLALRGWIYRWAYLPKLIEFGVFDDAETAFEIGAGYGTKLQHTISQVPQVSFRGIEQSSAMLERGMGWYPDAANLTELGDATNLVTISDETQDILMYYQILHHLGWEELELAAKEAFRVLRSGGKIAVIDTFLDDNKKGWNQVRRSVFNTIEPVYSLVSTNSGVGYANQPQAAFIQFMLNEGFSLAHESKPFGKLSVSEILVFQKND